eukprot:GHVU01072600.1.p1 GENE.GHVU01072600.1~~GHVU01072600.1.p1  ORF type:complete len:142 (-),score=7.87 GHVU01072600.1:689-1114(-)
MAIGRHDDPILLPYPSSWQQYVIATDLLRNINLLVPMLRVIAYPNRFHVDDGTTSGFDMGRGSKISEENIFNAINFAQRKSLSIATTSVYCVYCNHVRLLCLLQPLSTLFNATTPVYVVILTEWLAATAAEIDATRWLVAR